MEYKMIDLLVLVQDNEYHYIDSRQLDGTVAISKFNMRYVNGILTTPPQGYRFVTHDEMQTAMRQAALQLGFQVRSVTSAQIFRGRRCMTSRKRNCL